MAGLEDLPVEPPPTLGFGSARGGDLCQRMSQRMAQATGRSGVEAASGTVPAVAAPCVNSVLPPSRAASHPVSARIRREFLTVSTTIDRLVRRTTSGAAGIKAQRRKALETAVRRGGAWYHARGFELVASEATLVERVDTETARREHAPASRVENLRGKLAAARE